MKVCFLVNSLHELTSEMSTSLLIHRVVQRGHSAWVCGVEELEASPDDRLRALVRAAPDGAYGDDWCAALRSAPREVVELDDLDLVWIRTNPARDPLHGAAHRAALRMLQILAERRPSVLNDPQGLLRASSKLYLNDFPTDLRPRTLVSSNAQRLRRFVEQAREAVLKPLEGTHGAGVFKVAADGGNLSTIVHMLLSQGPVIAQDVVHGADQGDVRVLVLEGRPLTVDGQVAAVRRVPGEGEFRSNIHAGGRPEPEVLDEPMRRLVARVGGRLRADGLFLVGLDVIEGRIIEINAFSPGGFGDAEAFCGVDFAGAVVEAAEGVVRSSS
ncbi:MAG: hypothetical protein D6731_17910 [Planctomycetota bacterium]|nr:MAG: hypothetical protein D6731_17910 [Planctomycetota bacterium]